MITEDIIRLLNIFAPYKLDENDYSGLQIGSLKKRIKKVLLALDITQDVLNEAIENSTDIIITHHPLFYESINNINNDTVKGKLISSIVKNNISVYTAHSNLDISPGGINDKLTKLLDIKNSEIIKEMLVKKLYKIVVFVPYKHAEELREVISKKGAGWIGNYSHCSFNVEGIGTFMPRENTNPYIGKKDKLEKVWEVRIETIVTEDILEDVLSIMIKKHPYEEVAYDIYPLINKTKVYGIGRIGNIQPTKLKDFAQKVKKNLDCGNVKVYGKIDKTIERVAVCGGSGSDLINIVNDKGADAYITGDIRPEDAKKALDLGLNLIDANYYNTEKIILPVIKQFLESETSNLEISVSEFDNIAPFSII
ncbi:MAG: Nif3-like dinuclear metal center hexameric protein [Firmicutes bacterium]|nr:Nif3-like dinuclear metal center hexameric protein [Bacillota bacterium]